MKRPLVRLQLLLPSMDSLFAAWPKSLTRLSFFSFQLLYEKHTTTYPWLFFEPHFLYLLRYLKPGRKPHCCNPDHFLIQHILGHTPFLLSLYTWALDLLLGKRP